MYWEDQEGEMKVSLAIERLREIKIQQKLFKQEEDTIKDFLREIAQERRSDEISLDLGGVIVAFQRPIPLDLSSKEGKELKFSLISIFGDERGEELFSTLFERIVRYKPISGFVETWEKLPNKEVSKLNKIIRWKKSTPLIQV